MSQQFHYKTKERYKSSPKAVVLREEFVTLTQDPLSAIVLNQLLYWTIRVKDFDLLLEEERFYNPECNVSSRHGWIYKTAKDLIQETMICVDRTTMRRYLKSLITQGWLEERSNPHNKWDKTSQYRLNLRKLQEDLFLLGFELPGIHELLAKPFIEPEEPEESNFEDAERTEVPNVQNVSSKGTPPIEQPSPSETLEGADLPLEEDSNSWEEKSAPSERENSPLNIQRLYTETKHRKYTKCARARENFSLLEKMLVGDPSDKDSIKHHSLAQDMVDLWERHIVQKLFPKHWQGTLQLSETRKDQLELLFAFHFKNDIRLWERFCVRIKSTPFLMGESPSKWHISLDWILKEGNLRKILEGNYDNFHRREDEEDGSPLDNFQPDPACDAEKVAILSSIQDPIWKEWCTKLAAGERLNELQIHAPLSAFQLRQIANARFLECEGKRLIWIGSSDSAVLNAIEALRLHISWVYAKKYPKARTLRTRLISEPHILGENSHA